MITGPVKSSLCTKGLLAGKEVTVMRDTGCSGVVVKKDLVSPEDLTGDNDTVVLANGMCVSGPAAVVQIDTLYYRGEVRAVCFVSPLCDVLVGNVTGARNADDPNPN
jgi:hypothetical protein